MVTASSAEDAATFILLNNTSAQIGPRDRLRRHARRKCAFLRTRHVVVDRSRAQRGVTEPTLHQVRRYAGLDADAQQSLSERQRQMHCGPVQSHVSVFVTVTISV